VVDVIPMRRFSATAACTLLGVAACAKSAEPDPNASSGVHELLAHSSATAMPAPKRAEPAALAELLAEVPTAQPRTTGPSGTTLVGTDTKVARPKPGNDVGARVNDSSPLEADGRSSPLGGRVFVRPPLSSAVLERAAREQLYWPLSRACRLPGGELPPADSIDLSFDLRPDGSVLPSSVTATAADPRHSDAAACVERVFAASGFRGPIEGLKTSTSVRITWPSVD
jgi:hypothetical protein